MVRMSICNAVGVYSVAQSDSVFGQRNILADQCHIAQVPRGSLEPWLQFCPDYIGSVGSISEQVMWFDGLPDHPLAGAKTAGGIFFVLVIVIEMISSRDAVMRRGFLFE